MTAGSAEYQGVVGDTFPGAAVQFDLVTRGSNQYLAYFSRGQNIVVKHRTVGATDGPWTSKVILEANYNPDAAGKNQSFKNNWDSHNYLKLGIDASGNVHVAGDMHGTAFRYWRTTTPGDLTSFVRDVPLVGGGREGQVTYPEFINRPNGALGWLMFRDGASGNGDTYVYEWNNSNKTWSNLGKLFESAASYFGDGQGNAYMEVFYTLDGWFHIVYNWRESNDGNSNSKLSYVKTQNFVDYFNVNDIAVPTPITANATRPTVDLIPTSKDGSGVWIPNGFVNGEVQFGKAGTHTFIAYTKLAPDSAGTTSKQLFMAHHDTSGGWTKTQITEEIGGVGLVGNNYPDNYVSMVDTSTIAVDFKFVMSLGYFTRRVVIPISSIEAGPFASIAAPKYYPTSVYQIADSALPGVTAHTEADSRSNVQVGGVQNRFYINSRQSDNILYVVSWLAGPDTWFKDPEVTQAEMDSWPVRNLHMYKVTW